MKRLAFTLLLLTTPAFANDPNWNGDPEPPETPAHTERDRNDPLPQPRPLPCCIRDGQLVLTPGLFMSAKRAQRICEREMATRAAEIFECPGVVSPEAIK